MITLFADTARQAAPESYITEYFFCFIVCGDKEAVFEGLLH